MMMRACFYERTGPAADVLRLGEVEKPEAGDGEVLVRVMVSGLNPTDVKRRGGVRGEMPFSRIIPHFDGAGTVVAVGAGVPALRIGERVWIWEGQLRRPCGTAAEFVAVSASRALKLPDDISFETGASIGVPAMTAARALRLGGPLEGETVFVTGGAGMVGNAAIRLAKHAGARVITTVSSPEKATLAETAGADTVVNYKTEDVAEAVLSATGGAGVPHMVDVDLAAHLPEAWRYLKPNASIASYGTQSGTEPRFPFGKYMYKNIAIFGVAVFDIPEDEKPVLAETVEAALKAGRLDLPVDRIVPLPETATAHEHQESGRALGKILIRID